MLGLSFDMCPMRNGVLVRVKFPQGESESKVLLRRTTTDSFCDATNSPQSFLGISKF